jgi:hypothetical protein
VAVFDSLMSTNDDNDDDSVSFVVPPMEELDIVLIAAFTTTNLASYIEIIQDLPPDHVFHTTSNVTFMIHPMAGNDTNTTVRVENDANEESGSTKKGAKAGAAAGAGVFVLALISMMAVRHRKTQKGSIQIDNQVVPPNKRNVNDQQDDEGHITVAGDTYLAESTVVSGGTTSILSSLSATRHRNRQRFRNKRRLNQSRALVMAPNPSTNETQQFLTLPHQQPPALPSLLHEFSDNGYNDPASDQEIYENDDYDEDDDQSLIPFYTSSPEPAYQGALSVDVNERRPDGQRRRQYPPELEPPPHDVLLSIRDDMRLPRHFRAPMATTSYQASQYSRDDGNNHIIANQLVLHHDIDRNGGDDVDDDETLSVDDDVPMRVIDLIRKFTPTKRHKAR